MPAALDIRKIDRFVELVALGLEPAEAARAVPIGAATGKRLMHKADITERIERQRKDSTGGRAAVRDVVDSMLSAKRADGTPDTALRAKGAELFARPGMAAVMEADDEDIADALPDGFIVLCPRRPGEGEEDIVAVRKCADTLRKALGVNPQATAALNELLNEYVPCLDR